MQIYLPIAELSMNLFFLIGIGGAVGFLSGLFGVGGGFLLTPLLIFSGVPAPVAVASVTGQVAAASTSGALSYYRRGGIDLHLALYLILARTIGAMIGVATFSVLRAAGQLDLFISVSYLVLLGFVGTLMMIEAVRTHDAAPLRRRDARQAAEPAQLDAWAADAHPLQEIAALYLGAAGARRSACSSAGSARCSASAAASSSCRRWSICCACRAMS